VKNLRSKILILAMALVVVTQVGTLATILFTANRNVSAQAQDSLETGGSMFRDVMHRRTTALRNNVKLLAADTAFREAVSSQHIWNINTALVNHASRIEADVGIVFDSSGRVLAATLGDDLRQAALPDILHRADVLGMSQATLQNGNEVYDLVTVPLSKKRPGSWLSMGLRIDNSLANELREILRLEVTLLSTKNGHIEVLGTSMFNASPRDIAETFADETYQIITPQIRTLNDDDFLVVRQPFGSEDSNVVVVLQKSIYEAMGPYRTLRIATVVLGSLALLLAVLGAFILAGAITRPVMQLAQAAKRITDGDYSKAIDIRSNDELAELAVAFNAMQDGISDREKRIRKQALFDSVTELPNRVRALELLSECVKRAESRHYPLNILLLDLNSLGAVGSSLGHEFSDALIQQSAERVRANIDKEHILARLGGDEFLIVMENADVDFAREAAKELVRLLKTGVKLQDTHISLDACIGICTYPAHGKTADQLLQRAAVAKHDAKRAEEGLGIYEAGTEQRHLHQLSVLSDLRRAASDNELVLYLQPKIDLKSREICGAEALVRWDHPTLGFLAPTEFIPIAEKSGNISIVSNWVITAAFRECRKWRDEGLDYPVSINLSGRDLQDPDLPYFIMNALRDCDLDPKSLIIEITEEVLVHDFKRGSLAIEYLREMGARIALDDFGTGFSSLAQIKRLPLDELKIDRTFVKNLPDNREDQAIVSSTIELAHSLGLEVVAEGVETRPSMDWLAEHGCERAQGYLISRPMPADIFVQWASHFEGEVATQIIAFSPRMFPAS
jgi:diguanylate cyclase (GGDEF)-like protein